MIKLNGHIIEPTIFPDGTSQVWKIPEEVFKKREVLEMSIVWDFRSESEFIHLAQLCDLLQSKGLEVDNLHIPYFPYARQDKEVSNNTTFAKSTFMKLLNNLPGIRGISSVDIHSNNFNPSKFHWDNTPFCQITQVYSQSEATMICFPDTGASIRYNNLPKYAGSRKFCSMSKERDQDTGYIKRIYMNELVSVKDEVVLIVDDLCDGGMTFKLTAEKLLQCGAKEVILYTTHGIYSKGVKTLLDSGISRVFNYKGEVFPHKQTRFLLKEF